MSVSVFPPFFKHRAQFFFLSYQNKIIKILIIYLLHPLKIFHLCPSNKDIHVCYIFKTKETGNISLQVIKNIKTIMLALW